MNWLKKSCCLMLSALLLLLTACSSSTVNRDPSTTVTTGQISNGEITYGDQTFSVSVESLTLNVQIRSNEKLDLSPLAQCINLQRLSINVVITPHIYYDTFDEPHIVEQPAVDLTPLASLTALRRVDLNVGRIADLTPLTQLPNLGMLVLWIDGGVDLTPLAGCASLTELAIGGRGAVDLSAIPTFPVLTGLRVDVYDSQWNTPDLSALSGAPNLTTLSTGGSRGLSELKDVPLKRLVDLNDSGDILLHLPALDTLEQLEISDEYLSDITPLLQYSPTIANLVLEVGAQDIKNYTVIRSADDPVLTALITTIPLSQLRSYLAAGGTSVTLVVNTHREAGAAK